MHYLMFDSAITKVELNMQILRILPPSYHIIGDVITYINSFKMQILRLLQKHALTSWSMWREHRSNAWLLKPHHCGYIYMMSTKLEYQIINRTKNRNNNHGWSQKINGTKNTRKCCMFYWSKNYRTLWTTCNLL